MTLTAPVGKAAYPRPRLLMIGLDGADLRYIRARAGALPILKAALDAGQVFEPEAPEALTGSVWPTFYTGKSPGEHGIYQHLVWDSARMKMRHIDSEWIANKPFWTRLEENGNRVVVCDVPYCPPGSLAYGTEITDWATHSQTWPSACNQAEVRGFLSQFGASPIGRETPIEKTDGQMRAIHAKLLKSVEKKTDLVRHLMRERDWDLFLTVFGETHRAGHLFFSEQDEPMRNTPPEPTPMLDVYQAVDRALASVLEEAGPHTHILLFSVHGMERNYAQQDVLEPMLRRVNERFLEKQFGPEAAKSGAGLIRYLRRMVPARLQYAVGAAAPDALREWVVEREIIGGLNWARTPCFALRTDIRAELRLNLKGREKNGMLEPGSKMHEDYVTFLRQALSELRDAQTGALLVEDVVDLHSHFEGMRVDDLPDFAIRWRREPAAKRVTSPMLGDIDIRRAGPRGGDHSETGFGILIAGARGAPAGLSPPEKTEDFADYVGELLS